MTYLPPSNTFLSNAYFYANNTFTLGSLVQPVDAVTQITIDYTQLSLTAPNVQPQAPLTIPNNSPFFFTIDTGNGPPLTIDDPDLNNSILTFTVSRGVPGAAYTIAVNIQHDSGLNRTDLLYVNIEPSTNQNAVVTSIAVGGPSLNNGGFTNPIMIGSDLAFVSTVIRYFVGAETPEGPNLMDQWWNPVTQTLAEYVTDGTNMFWQIPTAVTQEGIPESTGPNMTLITSNIAPYPYILTPIASLINLTGAVISMGTF